MTSILRAVPIPAGSPGMIGTTRLEAFSDAVFSIAATLLVIEVAVPHSEDGSLGPDLLAQWPSYVAYAVSFATIAVMWTHHHFLMGLMTRVDRSLISLNLLLLLVVAFIPFPTAVVADTVTEVSEANLTAAAVLYGAVMIALTVSYSLLWLQVRRRPGLAKNGDVIAPVTARALFLCAVAGILYLIAIAIAWFAPAISLIIYIVVAALFAIGRIAR